MKPLIQIKTTIPSLLVSVLLVCFGLLPMAQAVGPDTDGTIPGSNNGEGIGVLVSRTTGVWNTGTGFEALNHLTAGNQNTAIGDEALNHNTTANANFNDAVGASALFSNTDGFSNNAFGDSALFNNIHGAANTAIGDVALAFNDSDAAGLGNNNTAVGAGALFNNVDGSENTVVGTGSGQNLIAGVTNTYLGNFVGSFGPVPDESSTIRIGDLSTNGFGSADCYIGGIFNNFQPVGGSVVEVTLDLTNDHLGWDVGPSQGGGAHAAPRSAPGRRSAPGAPAERPTMPNCTDGKVEKLEATVAQQQKQVETLTARLREQAAQIQKVSALLEVNKPASQVVL